MGEFQIYPVLYENWSISTSNIKEKINEKSLREYLHISSNEKSKNLTLYSSLLNKEGRIKGE